MAELTDVLSVRHVAPDARERIAAAVADLWPAGSPLAVLCLGIDTCVGDAVGPIVGTLLSHSRLPSPDIAILGSMDRQLGRSQLGGDVPPDLRAALSGRWVLAVDAMIGEGGHAGLVVVRSGPAWAGSFAGPRFGVSLGDASVLGCVVDGAELDPDPLLLFRLLAHVPLGLVAGVAGVIAAGLLGAMHLRAGTPLPAADLAAAPAAAALEAIAHGGR